MTDFDPRAIQLLRDNSMRSLFGDHSLALNANAEQTQNAQSAQPHFSGSQTPFYSLMGPSNSAQNTQSLFGMALPKSERRRSVGDGAAAQSRPFPAWVDQNEALRSADEAAQRRNSNSSSHVFEVDAPFLVKAESVPAQSNVRTLSPKQSANSTQCTNSNPKLMFTPPLHGVVLPTSGPGMLPNTSLSHIAESRSGRANSGSFLNERESRKAPMISHSDRSAMSSSDLDEAESEVDEWQRQRRNKQENGYKRRKGAAKKEKEKEKEAMLLMSPQSIDGHPLLFSDFDETDTDLDLEPSVKNLSMSTNLAVKPRHSALLRAESTSKWDSVRVEEQTDEMEKHLQHMRHRERQQNDEDLMHIQEELQSLKQMQEREKVGNWISE